MGHALAFDTLTFASDLQDAGMDEKQAKALAKGLYNSQDRIIEDLATKMDVAAVKNDVALVKKDLEVAKQDLESKIDKLDAKFESKIDKLDAKFESKIDKLDAKFESRIDKLDSKIDFVRKDMESNHQLVKWMIGTTLAGVVAILIRSFF